MNTSSLAHTHMSFSRVAGAGAGACLAVAGLLFVIPGALVMMALCLLYVLGGNLTLVAGLFFGIKAAVIAIVIEALLKIGKRALRSPFLVGLAVASFVALAFLAVDFPFVIGAAALLGAGLATVRPDWLARSHASATAPPPDAVGEPSAPLPLPAT